MIDVAKVQIYCCPVNFKTAEKSGSKPFRIEPRAFFFEKQTLPNQIRMVPAVGIWPFQRKLQIHPYFFCRVKLLPDSNNWFIGEDRQGLWWDDEQEGCLLSLMRSGKLSLWAFCQNETSFGINEWGFAQKLWGFYEWRKSEGWDGAEGEVTGADWERTGRTYTKKSPTVERTVGECVVGVPLGETRDAERV